VATLGRFPEEGEVIPVGSLAFEVLKLDGHRIDQVRVVRTSRPEGPPT
jgi:CBS domain containing-hemolysin-like protein